MTQKEVDKTYDTNTDFKEYVDRVANCYGKTVTQTLEMAIVYEVCEYYAKTT